MKPHQCSFCLRWKKEDESFIGNDANEVLICPQCIKNFKKILDIELFKPEESLTD